MDITTILADLGIEPDLAKKAEKLLNKEDISLLKKDKNSKLS